MRWIPSPADGIPLILLPGMGSDERVFRAQAAAFPNLIVPKWLAPRNNEPLTEYARRFAERLDPGRPFFLGGASFGGFVAMEVARRLRPLGCFLIGSVRSPDELPPTIRALRIARCLTGAVPFELLAAAGWVAAASGSWFRPMTRGFLRQLADADAGFLRWASQAVLNWRTDRRPPDGPVLQIHGECDLILPAAYTRPDVIIPGGGHVISLCNAQAVNGFLRGNMAALAEGRPVPVAEPVESATEFSRVPGGRAPLLQDAH